MSETENFWGKLWNRLKGNKGKPQRNDSFEIESVPPPICVKDVGGSFKDNLGVLWKIVDYPSNPNDQGILAVQIYDPLGQDPENLPLDTTYFAPETAVWELSQEKTTDLVLEIPGYLERMEQVAENFFPDSEN